jgi:hypothetical protein
MPSRTLAAEWERETERRNRRTKSRKRQERELTIGNGSRHG